MLYSSYFCFLKIFTPVFIDYARREKKPFNPYSVVIKITTIIDLRVFTDFVYTSLTRLIELERP